MSQQVMSLKVERTKVHALNSNRHRSHYYPASVCLEIFNCARFFTRRTFGSFLHCIHISVWAVYIHLRLSSCAYIKGKYGRKDPVRKRSNIRGLCGAYNHNAPWPITLYPHGCCVPFTGKESEFLL